MSNHPRVAKVLAALLASMTTGAVVLMLLGNNAPSAGAFCLSSYYRLDPVKQAVNSKAVQSPDRWNNVEVYYSRSKAGNIQQLASLNGLSSEKDLNCHFVVCNGLGAPDGEILTTEKWQKQWSAVPGRTWYGSGQTIRICVIADGREAFPTDFQIKRVEALVRQLHRSFRISRRSIYYPRNWQYSAVR